MVAQAPRRQGPVDPRNTIFVVTREWLVWIARVGRGRVQNGPLRGLGIFISGRKARAPSPKHPEVFESRAGSYEDRRWDGFEWRHAL